MTHTMRNALRHFDRLSARHLWHLPRNTIVLLIRSYQHTLSPDHGPLRHLFEYGYCRHSPTCSEYAMNVISKRGAIVGSTMAVWRVLTCNPWTKPDEARVIDVLKQ